MAFTLYLVDGYAVVIVLARILDAISVTTLSIIALAKAEDHIHSYRGEKSGYFLTIQYIGKIIAPPLSIFLADFFFIQFPFHASSQFLAHYFCSYSIKRSCIPEVA